MNCLILIGVMVDLVPQERNKSMNNVSNIIPIWEKINLTILEASEYSNIGISTIRRLLQEKGCPFLLKIGSKSLIKRKEFESYLKDKHYI